MKNEGKKMARNMLVILLILGLIGTGCTSNDDISLKDYNEVVMDTEDEISEELEMLMDYMKMDVNSVSEEDYSKMFELLINMYFYHESKDTYIDTQSVMILIESAYIPWDQNNDSEYEGLMLSPVYHQFLKVFNAKVEDFSVEELNYIEGLHTILNMVADNYDEIGDFNYVYQLDDMDESDPLVKVEIKVYNKGESYIYTLDVFTRSPRLEKWKKHNESQMIKL